jgi:uncharacterized membrane protein YeaQ/YmgE (transglycosylase-associated protein family)
MIMGTNAEQGPAMNIVVGIIGAIIGGFIVRMLTGWDVQGFTLSSLLVAILGAIILLALVRLFRGGNPHHA